MGKNLEKRERKMSEESDVLTSLQHIEDLLTILVKVQLANVTAREFSDTKMKKLYDLTGDRSARELAKEMKCSPMKISRTWQRWENLGLLIKDGKTYRKVL